MPLLVFAPRARRSLTVIPLLIDRQYQLSDEHQAQQVIDDATADDVLGLSATATIQAEAIEASRE